MRLPLGAQEILWILLALLVIPVSSQARVFDFGKESVAPYFRGESGLSSVGNKGFYNAKGEDVSLPTDKSLYNFGAEFGVLLHLSMINLRLGAEVLQSKSVKGIKGSSANGTELYSLNSETFVFHPNFTLEIIHKQMESFRFFSYLGVGQGSLTLENEYAMTEDGETALVPSYKEKLEATTISYFGGVGIEALISDTTTVELDAGYRNMVFSKLTHKGNITTIQGSFSEGDAAINDDGSERKIDFSGFYIGLSFRFYIEII